MRPRWRGNVENLATAARLLGELADEVVFVGGAATGLLLTDPAAPDVRPTLDVDVVVEVASRTAYYRFEERLREHGFLEAPEEEVICRWKHREGKIILDVMPTDEGILGFSERPLVSTDFRGDPRSSIIDAEYTVVSGSGLAKIVTWYDNEWGYSCRVADLIKLMADKGL